MTKRKIIMLLSSILLALCVIATSILVLINSSVDTIKNIESLILTVVIILVSIFSVFLVYFSKVRKDNFEKILNREYFNEYEIIKDSIMNSQLSNNIKKEIKEDILDILITAQKAGKNAKEVISNPEVFVQEIIQSYSSPKRLAILGLVDGFIFFFSFIIGTNLFLWLEDTKKSFFEIGMDIIMIVFLVIVAFMVVPFTKKLTSTQNSWMFIVPFLFGIIFVILAEIVRKFFYNIDFVRMLLDGTVNMIPNITIFIIYLLLIPFSLFLKVYLRKGFITKIN